MSNNTLRGVRRIALREFSRGLNGLALLGAVKTETAKVWPNELIPPFVTRCIVDEVSKQFGLGDTR